MVALEVDAESTSKAMDLARSGRVGSRLAMSTGLANSSHRRRPRSAAWGRAFAATQSPALLRTYSGRTTLSSATSTPKPQSSWRHSSAAPQSRLVAGHNRDTPRASFRFLVRSESSCPH